jgi:hypothetical protein
MKRCNPHFGCMRIAQQIAHAFGVEIDKDIVRRVLAKHYRPDDSGPNGPSWLTFIAHAKDSLRSLDLFRCESILRRSHWVMLVMDVCTRRLVGFGVERANIDGVSVCRMLRVAIIRECFQLSRQVDRAPERRRDAPLHLPHRSRSLLFAKTLGRSIVAVCFTHRFQSEYEFATDRIHSWRGRHGNARQGV